MKLAFESVDPIKQFALSSVGGSHLTHWETEQNTKLEE